jgi:hypothetical protein
MPRFAVPIDPGARLAIVAGPGFEPGASAYEADEVPNSSNPL